MIYLETFIDRSSALETLTDNLGDNTCESWGKFVLSYEALLMMMYSLQSKSQVTVGEYYRGAIVGEGVKDMMLTLPSKSPVSYSEMENNYPETEGSSPPVMDATVVYKNGQGAKIDGLIRHSDPAVLRCFHFDNNTKSGSFTYRNIRNQTTSDMRDYVTHRLDTDVKLLHIYVSSGEMKGSNEAILKGDDVVITRSELSGFFGRTFGERVDIMLSRTQSKEKTSMKNDD